MERWPLLQAHVLARSQEQLRLCEVPGYGRCLEAQVACATGQLLAEEKPLVLGSSAGSWLSEACCASEDELDAMDDLVAGCLLLEMNPAAESWKLSRELSRESSPMQDAGHDVLLGHLSNELLCALGPSAPTILEQWRACCDVNAETWVELIEQQPLNPLICHVRFLFGLFAALAMAEHNCRPNARAEWDSTSQTMKLVAVDHIARGQRVSRSYLDAGLLMSPTSVRKATLQEDWGFECMCDRCRSDSEESTCADAASPFLPEDDAVSEIGSRGRLTLQKCAEPEGLTLDQAALRALRRAGSLCTSIRIPPVGTLHFLQQVAADLHTKASLTTVTLCLPCVSVPSTVKRSRGALQEPEEEEIAFLSMSTRFVTAFKVLIGSFSVAARGMGSSSCSRLILAELELFSGCNEAARMQPFHGGCLSGPVRPLPFRIPTAKVPAPMTKDEPGARWSPVEPGSRSRLLCSRCAKRQV